MTTNTGAPGNRFPVAALTLSASALVALFVHEGYTNEAVIPTKGDVPTQGFGSTTHEDGTPVKMGDKTDPVSAAKRTLAYTQQAEARIKRCLTAPLSQAEFDLYSNFSYQYGTGAFCKSFAPKLNAGDYVGACKTLLEYRFVAGYDCSTPGNKRCYGVWTRQLERYQTCMEAQ